MFQLTESTEARLLSVTNRTEKHGDEEKPAQSFGFKITGANTLLDMLSPTLRPAIYKALDEDPQAVLEGVPPSTPLLRTNVVERHTIKGKLEGWQLVVSYGIDLPMVMGSCKVDAFAAECHEGGTIDLFFRVGTSDLDAHHAGVMWAKQKQLVFIQVIAPKPEEKPIDGSKEGGGPGFTAAGDDGEGGPVSGAGDTQTRSLLGDDDEPEPGRQATDEFIARNTGGAEEAGDDSDGEAGEGSDDTPEA